MAQYKEHNEMIEVGDFVRYRNSEIRVGGSLSKMRHGVTRRGWQAIMVVRAVISDEWNWREKRQERILAVQDAQGYNVCHVDQKVLVLHKKEGLKGKDKQAMSEYVVDALLPGEEEFDPVQYEAICNMYLRTRDRIVRQHRIYGPVRTTIDLNEIFPEDDEEGF
jgi:hypothetical protein